MKHYNIYFKIDSEKLKIHITIPGETTENFEIQLTSQYREWKLNTKNIQFERMQKTSKYVEWNIRYEWVYAVWSYICKIQRQSYLI